MTVETSLERKLVVTAMITLTFVSLGTLLIVMGMQVKSEDARLTAIKAEIRDRLVQKGQILVDNHALAMRGLVDENAVSDILRLVNRTVHEDTEIEYGVFLEGDLTPLVVARTKYQASKQSPREQFIESLAIDSALIEYELTGTKQRELVVDGQNVYEFVAHVILDGEDAGSVRYGVSTAPMVEAIESARAASRVNSNENIMALAVLGLLAIGLGYIVTRQQSRRITEPIGILTDAADRIAGGDLAVQVDITSRDEIEALGSSFNKMVFDLSASYSQVAQAHAELEDLNKSLEEKVEKRTAELQEKNRDIDSMLQNMRQGICTVLKDLTIHSEFSKYLNTILEKEDLAGRDIMEVLFEGCGLGPAVIDGVQVVLLNSIGTGDYNYDLNEHLLPTEFTRTREDAVLQILEIDWNPIIANDVTEKVMIVIRDVTKLRSLEASMAAQKQRVAILEEIVQVPKETLLGFLGTSRRFVERNQQLLEQSTHRDQGVIEELFRNMHTIKGNARTHGFESLTDIVHQAEENLSEVRADEHARWDVSDYVFDHDEAGRVLEQYAEVYEETIEKYSQASVGSQTSSSGLIDSIEQAVASSTGSRDELSAHIAKLIETERSDSIEKILGGLITGLPSLAEDLSKPTPRVVINHPEVLVPRASVSMLENVFGHIFRNSIDHGVEGPTERIECGKPSEGTITVDIIESPENLMFAVYDDGRGLDMEMLKSRAQSMGLNEILDSEQQIADLIFVSGVSTAERVSDISGRGVGMDAVKAFIEDGNGSCKIELTESVRYGVYRPFKLIFSVPV